MGTMHIQNISSMDEGESAGIDEKFIHNCVGVIQGYGGASIGGVYDGNRVLWSLYT